MSAVVAVMVLHLLFSWYFFTSLTTSSPKPCTAGDSSVPEVDEGFCLLLQLFATQSSTHTTNWIHDKLSYQVLLCT